MSVESVNNQPITVPKATPGIPPIPGTGTGGTIAPASNDSFSSSGQPSDGKYGSKPSVVPSIFGRAVDFIKSRAVEPAIKESEELMTPILGGLTLLGKALNGVPKNGKSGYSEFVDTLKQRYHAKRPFLTTRASKDTQEYLSAMDLSLHLGTIPNKDLPLAVVIYPTADHNRAFDADNFPMIDTLVNSGKFNVLYYEVSTDDELAGIVRNVPSLYGKKIHTLVLGGHGESGTMRLGDDFDTLNDETNFLDINDYQLMPSLAQGVDANGQVLLDSCSNGEGKAGSNFNLANTIARALPGRKVHSVTAISYPEKLTFSDDLTLNVQWSAERGGESYIAQFNGNEVLFFDKKDKKEARLALETVISNFAYQNPSWTEEDLLKYNSRTNFDDITPYELDKGYLYMRLPYPWQKPPRPDSTKA